ncbi:MAG: hypothetical protein M1839_007221 [Geoglossum umbratile]|nr:MAG: hypothetical protein M1839_007221 [Geoglossum umbratile]
MSEPGGSSLFGQSTYQQHGELRYRRSRLRASLSVSSTLRKLATDIEPPSIAPELDDLRITQGLLSESGPTASSKANTRVMSQQGDVAPTSQRRARHASAPSLQTGEPQGHSRITSATWSTVSNRVFTNSSQSSERDALEFLAEYNRLGSKHGLPQLCHEIPSTVTAGITPPPAQLPVSWLFRKLLRKAPSGHTVRRSSNPRLTRNSSVSDIALLGRGRRDVLKDRTLEEIARLGGESVFLLPAGSASGPLTIPSCFSATGTFILQHGTKTPGIFRVPGSSTTINALYEHYSRQFQDTEKSVQLVQQTISSSQIPHHIPCNIHDVASIFKKLLIGLPGGILGSVPLFKALADIRAALFPSPDLPEAHQRKVEARLIALAVASFGSGYSMALICAVFGLLNLIGSEAEKPLITGGEGQNPTTKDKMGYEALGVIFGPLLLGSKMELVELHSEDDRGGLLVIPESPTRRLGGRRKRNSAKTAHNSVNTQVEKARMAAGVAEMLIRSWKEVVRQLRNVGAVGSEQPSETHPEGVVGGGASGATMGPPEHPLYEQVPDTSRSGAEIMENRSKRRSQTCSVSDTTSTLQTLLESNAQPSSLPRLPPQAQLKPTPPSESPLASPAPANSSSVEPPGLPLAEPSSQQLRPPSTTGTERVPASTPGGRPVSIHSGFSVEAIRLEQATSDSVSVGLKGIEIAPPGSSIEGAIRGNTRGNQPQSIDPCSRNTSTNNWRMSTDQTRLSEGPNDQEISILAAAGRGETSSRTWGTANGQGLQDLENEEGPNPVASLMDPDQETTDQHRAVDIRSPLPPEPADLCDAQSRTEPNAQARHPQSHSQVGRETGSGSLTPGPDVRQIPDWLLNMTNAALVEQPVAAPLYEDQPRKLGSGNQSYVEALDKEISTAFSATTPEEQLALQAPAVLCNMGWVEATGITPPDSVKSLKIPHLPDMVNDQDVPTRGSSVSQTMVKPLPSTVATPAIRKPGTASADRLDRLLPPPAEELEVARHINWRNSSELGTSRASSEQGLTPKLSTKGNATLYAEIRRLQRLLDLRTEEAIQAQRELEAMRKFKDSGTLSEKLREAQRDLKTWKNRAEWAEKRLLMQDAERRGVTPKKKGEDAPPTRGNRRATGLDRATMM